MLRFVLAAAAASIMGVAGGTMVANSDAPMSDPIAIVMVNSLDDLASDAKVVSEMVDEPKLKIALKAVEPLFGEDALLGGFDASRPAGLVLRLQGKQPVGYAMLPVKDMDCLEETFVPFMASIEECEGGVYHCTPEKKSDKACYVKPMGEWLLVSDRPDVFPGSLANVEEAAEGILNGADVGVRLLFYNIPAEKKEKFLSLLKAEALKAAARKHDERFAAFHESVAEGVGKIVEVVTTDLQTATLTASFDRETTEIELGLTIMAADGSVMAQYLNDEAKTDTQFAGFRSDEASAYAAATRMCPLTAMVDWESLASAGEKQIHAKIDGEDKSDEEKALAKKVVSDLIAIAKDTIASPKRDGVVALVAKPKARALVAAGRVSDGYALEETIGTVVEAIRSEKPAKVAEILEENVADYKGIHAHRLTFDIPKDAKDREKAVQILGGEKLEVVVGFGPEAVYVGVGPQAAEALKAGVDDSSDGLDGPRVSAMLSTIDLARFVAKFGEKAKEREDAAKALTVLESYADSDDIRFAVSDIENGRVATLTLEEGVVQLIAAAVREKHGK